MKNIPLSHVMKYLFLFFTVLCFLTNNTLSAEAIRLTSGQVLEGRIMEESDKIIVIQTSKGTFTIKKTDILEMERPDSKDTIIKAPADPRLSKVKLVAMSFIPGYSPLYNSKEHPEFGIPFAMLSLNYFYKFLQYQVNSKSVGYLDSLEMKNPMGIINTLKAGPDFVSKELGLYSQSNSANYSGANQYYTQAFYHYLNARTIIYNRHPDKLVNGQLMSEDEYYKAKKRYLADYVAVSVVNAAVSYFILNSEGGVGALYKAENNGIKTYFYAVPTFDGGVFGAVSRF